MNIRASERVQPEIHKLIAAIHGPVNFPVARVGIEPAESDPFVVAYMRTWVST